MELVSDLSSKAFIAELRRMISRRGFIHKIFSDNGLNFVGANRIIQHETLEGKLDYQDAINNALLEMNIEWQFISPSAPHFGGLWEAGVKSTKYHLKRIIGETKLTYEEFTTVLAQIGATLNTRPLHCR